MRKVYQLPEEKIEPEVLREMTIPLIVVDEKDDFEAHIKEKDLVDFEERDKKILLAMSVIEQKQDFLIWAVQMQNRNMRHLEAESIRQRHSAETQEVQQKVDSWKWSLIRWIGATIGAGILASIAKKWI